jgi:hypothetical protein
MRITGSVPAPQNTPQLRVGPIVHTPAAGLTTYSIPIPSETQINDYIIIAGSNIGGSATFVTPDATTPWMFRFWSSSNETGNTHTYYSSCWLIVGLARSGDIGSSITVNATAISATAIHVYVFTNPNQTHKDFVGNGTITNSTNLYYATNSNWGMVETRDATISPTTSLTFPGNTTKASRFITRVFSSAASNEAANSQVPVLTFSGAGVKTSTSAPGYLVKFLSCYEIGADTTQSATISSDINCSLNGMYVNLI